MARFTETVDIRPASQVQFDTGSLTARLDQFAAQKAQEGAQKIAQESFSKGQAAFQEGAQPEFKQERFFGKIPAKAYNEGLRAAYVASLDRDNREEISKIVAENPDDLSVFNDRVESYRSSMLNNVDPTARQVVQDSTDSLISSNRIKVQNNEIAKNHKENAQEVQNQIETASTDALGFARDGDNESAATSALAAFAGVDAAIQAGFISDTEGAVQKRDIERGLVEEGKLGGLIRTFDDEGETAAFQELDDLSKKRPKGFEPGEWDKFIARSQAEINRKSARLERESIRNAKQVQIEADFGAIEARIAGDDTQIINPKVADAYYRQRVLPSIANVPREAQEAIQAEYIDRLKLVPDTITKEVTNAANSNNPELLTQAGSLMDRIDQIPGVVNKVPTAQQAYIQNVVNLMQNMEPEEAVELARKATDPKDKARIEAVDRSLKEQAKDDPDIYLDRSEQAFRKLFVWNDPKPNDLNSSQMAKEYQSIYENFRRAGSTESDAFEKADAFIKRTWGVSKAMGRADVMKYPPDDYYSIDGDVSWIREQLFRDLADEVAGVSPDDVFLMSNEQTARTASIGQPAYAVKFLIDGVFYNADENWIPDMSSEIEKRKAENVRDALERRQGRKELTLDDADFFRTGPM